MAKLEFSDIRFEKAWAGEGGTGRIRLVFLKVFEMSVDVSALEKIGEYELGSHSIEYPKLSDKELANKFMPLLDRAFRELRSVLTGRKAVYVHQNSGIPLFGSLYFGIVDRGTNILEVKPITGCNIDCTFCSVNESKKSKMVDFVVEDDYLVAGVSELVEYKQEGDGVKIDVFINTHGEPLLYANIVSLVAGLRKISHVRTISIITNGTLLSAALLDELIDAGMDQLNLSVNAIDAEMARELAGSAGYDVKRVLDVAKHAAKRIKVIVAPVWIKGVNDSEIPKLVEFAKSIGAEVGIQNYMAHKKGKRIADEVGWEDFYKQLEAWEKQTGMSLKQEDHTLGKTKQLTKVFHKGDVVQAEIVSAGRMRNEVLAVAKGRVISVVGCEKERGRVKVRVLRDKDGVYVGEGV
jgi:uncharacterized Fe-S cluster-containing radical SAM superfamily enzyme